MTLSVICQTSVFAAFSDVGDDNTYKDAITTLTKLKVIDGYEDGTFKPDGQITRAEFTKLIVFILGYKDLAYDSSWHNRRYGRRYFCSGRSCNL